MSLLLIFTKASKTEIRSWHGTRRHNLGGCSFRECNPIECQEEEIMITEHSRTVVARESTRFFSSSAGEVGALIRMASLQFYVLWIRR